MFDDGIKSEKNSDKTISNHPATAQFGIILTQNIFLIFYCNHEMGMINMHFLVKPVLIIFKKNKFQIAQ